jgi:hypothetical protein
VKALVQGAFKKTLEGRDIKDVLRGLNPEGRAMRICANLASKAIASVVE